MTEKEFGHVCQIIASHRVLWNLSKQWRNLTASERRTFLGWISQIENQKSLEPRPPQCSLHQIDLISFCPACRGSARSKKKSVSSRLNGLLGGRPTKAAIHIDEAKPY